MCKTFHTSLIFGTSLALDLAKKKKFGWSLSISAIKKNLAKCERMECGIQKIQSLFRYATKYFMNLCWNGKFASIRDGWSEIPFIDQFVMSFFPSSSKRFNRVSKMTRMSTCIWINLSQRVFVIAYCRILWIWRSNLFT